MGVAQGNLRIYSTVLIMFSSIGTLNILYA